MTRAETGRGVNLRDASARVAASTAHPLATEAALAVVAAGGSAADGTIAAQAVIATVMPHAAGLGGDLLALVRVADGSVHAVNGTGTSPARAPSEWTASGGGSVTVPGLVDGWREMHSRWGRLPLARNLRAAESIARNGFVPDADLVAARDAQRDRLIRNGADSWGLLATTQHSRWRQPQLADLLQHIGRRGASAFYASEAAEHLAGAVQRHGGSLTTDDLAAHRTETPAAVSVDWDGGNLWVQPPSSQGMILAMAAKLLDRDFAWYERTGDHLLIEATEAAFEYRDRVIADGLSLLTVELEVDTEQARHRAGPRGYLHTAGVAVADRDGMVVSSLVSVFDDFGSAVFVPELGIVLNNRAAGFTTGANAARPAARPVHTLAPAIRIDRHGEPLALATPGADGQVQTLLQVLAILRHGPVSLDDALAAPRWRSEDGRLLVESGHPASADLARRGHRLSPREAGDAVFGAVVSAGIRHGRPYASADPRRNVRHGVR